MELPFQVKNMGGERGFEGKIMNSILVFMEMLHTEIGYMSL